MLPSDTRGQSETIGTLLLVGMLVITITLAGGAAVANYLSQASVDKPLVDLEIESEDSDKINIQHLGGEAIDTETTVVMVDGSILDSFEEADSFDGDRDGRFRAGELVTFKHSMSEGTIEVVVIDQASNVIIEQEEITLVKPEFDPTNGDDVVDEVESEGIDRGKCEEGGNICESTDEFELEEDDIDGFAYFEDEEEVTVELEDTSVAGAVVVNAGEEGEIEIEGGTIEGDLYIKSHADDGEIEVEIGDATIEGDIKVDANGEIEVETEETKVEGEVDETASLDLSEP